MLSFLSQVIVKPVDVSFNPHQPNDEFHTKNPAILFICKLSLSKVISAKKYFSSVYENNA